MPVLRRETPNVSEAEYRIDTASDGSQQIAGFDGVNLGLAAHTDRGLVIPTASFLVQGSFAS